MNKETVSANTEKEPFIPRPGSLWAFQSEAWYARFDYINARVEAYLDNFRESVEYDFTRISPKIEEAQTYLNNAMEEFAVGKYTVEKVKPCAVRLKDAFKRPEQVPKISELAHARANRNPLKEDGYITGARYMETMRKMSGDRLSYFIKANCSRLFFAGEPPIAGVTCCMVEGGGGFTFDGIPIPQYEAEKLIDEEIRTEMQKLFGKSLWEIERETPKPEAADKIPEAKDINTTGKTVDEIKAEAEALPERVRRYKTDKKLAK